MRLYLFSIVALTTGYIRVLHFCGQVPFLYVIIVGFVAVGQARPSRSTSRCTAWSTEDYGTPHLADSRSAALPHAEQLTLQLTKKMICTVAHTHYFSHAASFTRNFITYIQLHTYVYTYIHTYRFTFLIFHHFFCLSFLPCPR